MMTEEKKNASGVKRIVASSLCWLPLSLRGLELKEGGKLTRNQRQRILAALHSHAAAILEIE